VRAPGLDLCSARAVRPANASPGRRCKLPGVRGPARWRHFSSKTDDQPLFGPAQPPTRLSEVARHGQAQVVHDFVSTLLAVDPDANVIVLGDINDFEFSQTVDILEGGGALHTLVEDLAARGRYSYVFEGNSQVLDQILLSPNLVDHFLHVYDVVHVNSEFADAIQASDHEPSVMRLDLRGRPAP
jgi:uncharacterized protein